MATTERPRTDWEDGTAAAQPVVQRPDQGWRRLLPRGAVALSMLMLAASVGAAFSGAVLYAFYDYRLSKNEEGVGRFAATFDQRFNEATEALAREREDAKAQIRKTLEPIQALAGGETLDGLVKKASPSLWFVRTLDEAGQASVGSAFVVASDPRTTFLLTSYTTVRAATRQPGPAVTARHGEEELPATIWTWQEDRDLALVTVPKGNQPQLSWAPGDSAVKTGERIFAVSGLGTGGGAIAQGFVADVAANALQHGIPLGPQFQGGPLLNGRGEVVGVASRAYAPLGFGPDGIFFGIPIRATCERVLRCPSGAGGGPGQRR